MVVWNYANEMIMWCWNLPTATEHACTTIARVFKMFGLRGKVLDKMDKWYLYLKLQWSFYKAFSYSINSHFQIHFQNNMQVSYREKQPNPKSLPCPPLYLLSLSETPTMQVHFQLLTVAHLLLHPLPFSTPSISGKWPPQVTTDQILFGWCNTLSTAVTLKQQRHECIVAGADRHATRSMHEIHSCLFYTCIWGQKSIAFPAILCHCCYKTTVINWHWRDFHSICLQDTWVLFWKWIWKCEFIEKFDAF